MPHSAHPLRRALPLFLFAGLCLTSLDTTAKWLVRDHALFLVVWGRYAGQMLVVTPYVWHRSGPGFWRTRRLPLQLVRSSLLLIATFCFFAALRYLPLAEASAILHVRARDTTHLEETLERIRDHPGITRTQTQIVLSTLFERPFEE